jgi:hypothetical protein
MMLILTKTSGPHWGWYLFWLIMFWPVLIITATCFRKTIYVVKHDNAIHHYTEA